MESFIQQHHDKITAVVHGFDRLVLNGTLRSLAITCGMMDYLKRVGVLLKDFGGHVERKSEQLKAASLAAAKSLGRPILYLPSAQTNKEQLARTIAQRDAIEQGLVCVLTAVEPCQTYEVRRDRASKHLILEPRLRKCLFLYHYWVDEVFGFMNGRIQSWFPFAIRLCLNGREWLAHQMDRAGLGYERRDNCFVALEEPAAAQRLLDEQLTTNWPTELDRAAARLNPAHAAMLAPHRDDYYWTVHQSEWASDLLFKDARQLGQLYPRLTRAAMGAFGSRDVLRFLGRKGTGLFKAEVISSLKTRPEGTRLKHYVGENSVKMYDKQGQVLRMETTLNQVREFRVWRPEAAGGQGAWRPMNKGVADIHRRAQLSQGCNERYGEALASLDAAASVRQVVEPLSRKVKWKKAPVRGLRPWSAPDQKLLEAVGRGEWTLRGFRNRDLLELLYGYVADDQLRRKLAARVTHQIRLLRAHGLVHKVSRTRRYQLSAKGRQAITALLQAYELSVTKLTELAA